MPRLKAVSIDLWFTLIYDAMENYRMFLKARASLLHSVIHVYRRDVSLEDVENLLEEMRPFMMETPPLKLMHMVTAAFGISPEAVDEMYRRYIDSVEFVDPILNDDMVRLLEWVREKGLKLVLTTNTTYSEEMLWRLLGKKGIGEYFTGIVSSAEVGAGKPEKKIFMEAASKASVEPGEMVHIGDKYVHDAVGAYLAGLKPILYRGLWDKYGMFIGYGEGYAPHRYPPYIYVADSAEEIIKVLENLI